jgi:hypothetical protein
MLPNHLYPIPQREPLIRIIRNRRIHRSVAHRSTGRRCDHPPNMLIRSIPHLDPEGELLKYRQGVELAVTFVHENRMRTWPLPVKTLGLVGDQGTR